MIHIIDIKLTRNEINIFRLQKSIHDFTEMELLTYSRYQSIGVQT